jgi:hypothetical protein
MQTTGYHRILSRLQEICRNTEKDFRYCYFCPANPEYEPLLPKHYEKFNKYPYSGEAILYFTPKDIKRLEREKIIEIKNTKKRLLPGFMYYTTWPTMMLVIHIIIPIVIKLDKKFRSIVRKVFSRETLDRWRQLDGYNHNDFFTRSTYESKYIKHLSVKIDVKNLKKELKKQQIKNPTTPAYLKHNLSRYLTPALEVKDFLIKSDLCIYQKNDYDIEEKLLDYSDFRLIFRLSMLVALLKDKRPLSNNLVHEEQIQKFIHDELGENKSLEAIQTLYINIRKDLIKAGSDYLINKESPGYRIALRED